MRQKAPGALSEWTGVKEILTRDLANPPTLEMLGARGGLQPILPEQKFFSREVGHTIPQYLRNVRMERAAELLRTGRLQTSPKRRQEVGLFEPQFISVKHFAKTIGCCPVLYPVAKNVLLDR